MYDERAGTRKVLRAEALYAELDVLRTLPA